MYLKSIEIHGFKSFANKIVFQFHNGITGIVGPNGSGKSNVADAVRWVLGKQRIKQLRGASMQDVIFSGTETRKPLSYAYVAITLDNSDHQLAIDYDEVTVARRIYRSGESEYLINGTPCRLKDVNELFYDTGIGKEGYSIIGQGQIDKILSGKPEERRELFDEAAGIVKFKRRKAAAQTKLENEKQNLVRVNDILSELEKQVGPLERQSEEAKEYLRLREDARQAEDAARTAAASAEGLTQQLQGQLVTLLAQVQPFWPEANGAGGVRVALAAALRRREALDGAALQVQKAQIRCDAMSRHLPQPPLPDPEETLPRPVLSREQIDAALPQVRNQLREARSRVDSLTSQLRTMDSPESLQAQRDQCTRQLEALQAEYDAIALAMEALTQANTVLQTRFSPALGAETARIFSAITGGRYDKVLLDRNLSLSAQPAGDAMPRALSLLSQGAGDQLYLAVRLAICRMVLPRDKAAPLILDDALANFDDQRLAAALDWLAEESRSRQILLFTCHRREGDYLRDRAHVISLN